MNLVLKVVHSEHKLDDWFVLKSVHLQLCLHLLISSTLWLTDFNFPRIKDKTDDGLLAWLVDVFPKRKYLTFSVCARCASKFTFKYKCLQLNLMVSLPGYIHFWLENYSMLVVMKRVLSEPRMQHDTIPPQQLYNKTSSDPEKQLYN